MFKQKLKTQITVGRALVLVLPVLFFVAGVIAVLGLQNPVYAATSDTVNFQARLLTAAGNVVPDGYYNVEFKIYNAGSSSGSSQGSCTSDANCKWTETRIGADKVRVANGYLTVNLGSVTAFPGNMPWDQQLWLTMNIGGTGSPTWDGEMNPRLKLTSTPYSFASGKVVSSDGTGSATVANGDVGTICIQNSANCGFIKNQTSALQSATTNLALQGIDEDEVALAVKAASGQTVNIFEVQAADGAKILTAGTADVAINRSLVITGSGAASNRSLVVKANTNMNNTSIIFDIQQNNGTSAFSVNGGGDVYFGNASGSVQASLNISSGAYYGKIHGLNITAERTYALPDASGTICLQGNVSCGFVAQGTNDYIKNQQLVMQQAAIWVQGTDASKISFNFQAPAGSSADIFKVQNSDGTAAVSVTATGALSFTGEGTTSFTTPAGSNVPTKIKIDPFGPASFGQIIAFGLPSSAGATTRAMSVFDARTSSHQPTISVFSPSENDVFGFSWDGSNTLAAVKSSSSQIAIRTNGGDIAQFSTAIDLNRATNITGTVAGSSALYVQGAASGTVPVALIRGGATPGTNADLLQVQNASSTAVFSVGRDGIATFRNSTDSTSAFRVINNGGTTVLNIDTSGNRLTFVGGVSGDSATPTNTIFEIKNFNNVRSASVTNYGALYLNTSDGSTNTTTSGIQFNNNTVGCVDTWYCASIRKFPSLHALYFSALDGFRFWTGSGTNTAAMRIDSAGRVAVGPDQGNALNETFSVIGGTFAVRNNSTEVLRLRADGTSGTVRVEAATAGLVLSTWDQTNFAGGQTEHAYFDPDGTGYLSSPNLYLNGAMTSIDSSTLYMTGISSIANANARVLCIQTTAVKRVYYGANATCGTSSQRFKHDITDMSADLGLDTLMGLRPVTYVYNGDETNTSRVGLIAEEVAQILPQVVEYDENGDPYAINYEYMVANLIKGIQQQQVQIDDIQEGIWSGGLVSNDTTFNGYVTFNSSVTFVSDAEFNGKATFNGAVAFNENTTGSVTLPEGETEVAVLFSQPYENVPNISVSSSDFASLKVLNKTVNGFTVIAQNTLNHDITIDWIAIQMRAQPPPEE